MAQFHALFALLLLLPFAAWANEPLTAEAFERYTTGKTLTFARKDGDIYGSEEYYPNRRVLWAPLEGACKAGSWYEENDQICFVYDDEPDPKCWSFFAQEQGLTARYRNDPDATELYEVARAQSSFT